MNQKSDKSPNESVDISSETLEHLDQEVQEQQEKIKEQSETLQQTQEELETTSSALEEGRESLELLYKLSRSLVKVVDPAAVASDALELITEALSVLRGEVLLIDERTGKLEVLALVGYSDQEVDTYKQAADMRLNRGLAWKVSQSHEAVALPDVNCSEHWLSIPGLDDDICSAAAIPLLADEKMSGVMTLLSDEFDHLNEDRLELLTAIATQVALALQNAELFVSEQEARRVAEILREANLEMTQSLDVEQVSAISLKYLHALIHYDQAAVVLLPDGRELHILAYRGYETKVEPRPLKGKKLPLEKYPLLQHIIDTKESLVVEDTQEILDWQPVIVGGATRSWVSIPLIAGQGVVGLFTAGKAEADFFHQRDREVAEALAVQTATAIQNGELYEEVQSNRNRLRRLADQLITMQEAERKRVSRELHDEAGQALNALKVSLKLIHDNLPDSFPALREQLIDAVHLTGQTLDRIRFISYDLRPPELDTIGLDPALEEFCEEFSQRTHLEIDYQGRELPELADSIRISFYRFLQEALTNVVKHAEAKSVTVTLLYDDDRLCLSVTDDGRGFRVPLRASSPQWSKGLGILGIKERFEQLGGYMTIESKINQGTTITACVPLRVAQEEENS